MATGFPVFSPDPSAQLSVRDVGGVLENKPNKVLRVSDYALVTRKNITDVRSFTVVELEELYSKLNADLFSSNNLRLNYRKIKEPNLTDVDALDKSVLMINVLSEDVHTLKRVSNKPLFSYAHQSAKVELVKNPRIDPNSKIPPSDPLKTDSS